MPRTAAKPQSHMDDTIIENPELLRLLEEREGLKENVANYRAVDKKAKGLIQGIETPTPYRVGRFIIDKSVVAPKQVSFETVEGFRFTIKTADET